MNEDYQQLGPQGSRAGISSTSIKFSSLAVFVASTVGEIIVSKKLNLAAAFPAAMGVLIAVVGLVAYSLICGVALGLGWKTRTDMAVPWKVPAIIGALFSLHHMLLNVGAVPVPGPIILVLVKFVVPASMLLNMSNRTFGLRYRLSHWLSLAVLMVGMLIMLYPALHNSSKAICPENFPKCHVNGNCVISTCSVSNGTDCSGGVLWKTAHDPAKAPAGNENFIRLGGGTVKCSKNFAASEYVWSGSVLILISTLPLAGAFTYIELTLVKYNLNLFTVALWMYVCVFMVFFGNILAVPTHWLSRGVMHVSNSGTLGEGISCYVFGENPALGNLTHGNSTLAHIPDCKEASKLWYILIIFTLFANLAMPLSTRYAGATLMWFSKGFTVPLVGILFSMSCIMGEAASQLNMATVVGLAVVTLGVLGFNYEDPKKNDEPPTQSGNRVAASP